ncbi:MAG: portal protein, partial [Candidatus Thermoplasmatota archaeon]|nr:portal protein [Candidatus Thermoplasmatota archaeon]
MATAEVSEWKVRKVEELTTAVTESSVVAIADVKGIPAPQLQHIRQRLRGRARIIVSKKSLIHHSLTKLSESKEGIEKLADHLSGQVAFVLTDLNPFKLFKEMESTKTKAPARGGEVCPEDILVKEGDTPFKPGPIMSELQRAGLPASIERGTGFLANLAQIWPDALDIVDIDKTADDYLELLNFPAMAVRD